MDSQFLFNIVATLAGTLVGWVLKVLWDAVRDLRDDVKEIEKGYVMKDDYRIDIAEIKGRMPLHLAANNCEPDFLQAMLFAVIAKIIN